MASQEQGGGWNYEETGKLQGQYIFQSLSRPRVHDVVIF